MSSESPLYLDYNATTPIDPAVREAMLPFLAEHYGNPSSLHVIGQKAAEAVATARDQVAKLLGCQSREIIFTSGGTESSNLAITGSIQACEDPTSAHIITSAIEHPATTGPIYSLERGGCEVTVIGCNPQGEVDPQDIQAAIRPNTRLVSLMHANNEVGTIQPVQQVAQICRQAGVLFHVDAAQAVGKLPVSVDSIGADLITLAGHKFYAPKGIGVLFVREGVTLHPVLYGGGQELGLSPGTENVALTVALGKAAEIAEQAQMSECTRLAKLRDEFEGHLEDATRGEVVIHAQGAERLSNTSSIAFPGVEGQTLLDHIPFLCASTGAACHSHSTAVSATLAAMRISEQVARSTIRISLGRFTAAPEVHRAGATLIGTWKQLAGESSPRLR
ncbi:MAG: cysteine desulfurase family protein [Pirellulales bacterium]|nr:cysteine desulfurase family protein [Pirellulales bacterium]